MNRTKCFVAKQGFCLTVMLSSVLLGVFGNSSLAAASEDVQYYKMLSTIEYEGKSPFRNSVETLITVRKQILPNNQARYFLSTDDFDLVDGSLNSGWESSFRSISFLIDGKTGYLLESDTNLAFFGRINNQCVKSLKKVSKENIGKTWKQSFNLSSLVEPLPDELKFTLTAIQPKTKVYGDMIAVRALSEPFKVMTSQDGSKAEPVNCRAGAVYLFDSEVEDVYLNISVFEATTKVNGSQETFRHEVATYKTDAEGTSVDLNGLGKKFETFARKVGLTNKSLKITKQSVLPQWARSEGLKFGQIANICAATACEGGINPVAIISIPTAHAAALQSTGTLPSIGLAGTVSGKLVASVAGVGGMKIAVAPFMGVGLGTAGVIAGGTVGGIAAAGGGGGGSSASSP